MEYIKIKAGNAVKFKGEKSGAGVYKNNSALNMGLDDWTVSILFKIPPSSERFYFVSGKKYRIETGSNFKGSALIFPPDTKHIEAKGNGADGAALNDDKWHHMTAVYKRNSNLQIYIDGKPSGKPADISSLSNKKIGSGNPLRIFSTHGNGTCLIANFAIYKHAFSPEEAAQKYKELKK